MYFNLKSINVASGNKKLSSSDGILFNKDKSVLLLCPQAKASVTIPGSVKRIEDRAFYINQKIKSITLPNSVTSIGNMAFCGCIKLTSMTIPESVASMGDEVFINCAGLTSVTLPSGLTSIGEGMFWDCGKLTKVTIPDCVTSIGDLAFANCTALTSMKIPSRVKSIGNEAFSGCTKLTSVTIPDSVNTIKKNAFYGCTGLTKVTIPENVTTIGESAFGFYQDDNWKTQKIAGFTIYGKTSSAAETYAKKNGFKFIDSSNIAVTKIALDKTSLTLAVSQSDKLTVSFTPSNASDKTVTWSTSNKSVATVKNGTVTAVGAGSYKITAKSSNGKTASCKVTVTPAIAVEKLKLYKTKMTLGVGEVYTMAATILPGTATDKSLTWTTSNSSVAVVSDGKITAKSTGTATITVKTKNGKTAACNITVKKAPTKVTLPTATLPLGLGETYLFKPELPYGCASEVNTYQSSNNSVIRGTKGEQFAEFKALKVGTANITVKTYNGKTATCKVIVQKAPTWVALNKTSLTMKVGDRATLTARVAKGTAYNKNVFRADDSTVIQMISNTGSGVFKAIKPGVTNVTVTLYNGKQASCQVTVTE